MRAWLRFEELLLVSSGWVWVAAHKRARDRRSAGCQDVGGKRKWEEESGGVDVNECRLLSALRQTHTYM